MSYLFFSVTSIANGTRDTWGGPGGTSGTQTGRIDGVQTAVDQSAFDVPANDFVNGSNAIFDLEFLTDGDDTFFVAETADNRVFSGPASKYNPTLEQIEFDNGYLVAKQANKDWNAVKNIEMLIDSSELESGNFQGIEVRNFVDVRIKLGSAEIAEDADPIPGANYQISAENVKRGQMDFSDSDRGVDTYLTLSSNNQTWQNSFFTTGSNFNDTLIVERGDHTGKSTDNQTLNNTGSLSFLNMDMGNGNDLVDTSDVLADTLLRLGKDDGELFLEARSVKIGFSEDQGDSKTTQLTDWLDDGTAGGLDIAITAYTQYGTANEVAQVVDSAADIAAATRIVSAADAAAALLGAGQILPPDVVGLGIAFGGSLVSDAPNFRNFEINTYPSFIDGSVVQTSDAFGLSWDEDAFAAEVEFSLFYTSEFDNEFVIYELYDDGVLVSTDTIQVEIPTGAYQAGIPGNPGIGHICINDDVAFDEIILRPALNTGDDTLPGSSKTVDFLVNGIELFLSGQGAEIFCGGDVAYLGGGTDDLYYDVGNEDGTDEIYNFTKGDDTLTIDQDGDITNILEVDGDTVITFAGYTDGAIILRGVTGAVVGTDIILV
jgi:hypothetical protein